MVTERQASFVVPAAPESAGLARGMVKAIVRAWRSRVDVDTLELLTSEVVTNALLHGIPPETFGPAQIRVEIRETTGGLHVEVHDPDHGESHTAAPTQAASQDENGRGLILVEMLSAKWGQASTSVGKYVHFDVLAPALSLEEELASALAPEGHSTLGAHAVACAPGRSMSGIRMQIGIPT